MTQSLPRAASKSDVVRLLRSLADHGVDYVLIGGQALNIHGYMRATEDIDLLLPMDAVNGQRVIDALCILQDQAAKEVDPQWLAEEGTVRVNDEIIVDLMTVAANGETYNSLQNHIQQQEMDGFLIRVLDLTGLRRAKESVREKDAMDRRIIDVMLKEQERTTGMANTEKPAPDLA